MNKCICSNCGVEFERYKSLVRNEKTICCSKNCSAEQLKHTMKGINNPNFGNEWSKSQKNNQSIIVSKAMDNDEIKYKVGSANRGKKFSKERCRKMSLAQKGVKKQKISEETKRKIGIASSKKFTKEFKENLRKKMEDGGYWIPLSRKTDWEIYKDLSNWKSRMFDFIEDENQLNLLEENGVFNSWENRNGVVRDHMYSRKSGFENGVFPEILRHPANCQLLIQKENIKKKTTKYRDADAITLETLFKNILNYQKKEWKEQELCVILIQRYLKGYRWKNLYKKEEMYHG